MSSGNKINVTICGETFSLASINDEEYVKTLAAYVDSRLEDITRARSEGTFIKPSLKMALLALNIADDYYRECEKNEAYSQTVLELPQFDGEVSRELRKRLAELEDKLAAADNHNKKLADENNLLKTQLKNLRDELNEAKKHKHPR